jgi:hypothetical protein
VFSARYELNFVFPVSFILTLVFRLQRPDGKLIENVSGKCGCVGFSVRDWPWSSLTNMLGVLLSGQITVHNT